MRGTEYLILVIFFGICSIAFGLFILDLNNSYAENPIDGDTIEQYNDFEKVAETANNTFAQFQKLGDESKWYQKIGAGIVAIPYAVINFPIMIYQAVSALTKFMGGGLTGLIPAGIMVGLTAWLTVLIVRELMSFFQRSRS